MSFSVTILGSGSAVPTSRRNPSAQFIQCASRNILIDCGEGTQMAMRKYGVKFQKLDIILISHMHGDHYFGLIGLLNTMHLLGRTKELKIFSPPALKEIIQLQVGAGNGGFSFPINYTAVEEGQNSTIYEDVKVRIACFPLKHKIPTSGFIITEKEKERKLNKDKADKHKIKIEYYHRLKIGEDVRDEQGQLISHEEFTFPPDKEKRYAYCSDTGYHIGIVDMIRNVDLLYHEATFIQEHRDRAQATKHSTAMEAASIAKAANVKKLILGHLSARYDSADQHEIESKQIFGNTEVVEDGNIYAI